MLEGEPTQQKENTKTICTYGFKRVKNGDQKNRTKAKHNKSGAE